MTSTSTKTRLSSTRCVGNVGPVREELPRQGGPAALVALVDPEVPAALVDPEVRAVPEAVEALP